MSSSGPSQATGSWRYCSLWVHCARARETWMAAITELQDSTKTLEQRKYRNLEGFLTKLGTGCASVAGVSAGRAQAVQLMFQQHLTASQATKSRTGRSATSFSVHTPGRSSTSRSAAWAQEGDLPCLCSRR